jgi:hypothetical protein
MTRSDRAALDVPFLERQPDERRIGAPERLRGEFAQVELVDRRPHAVEVDRVRVSDLDHRAAAEVDAEIEAAGG